MLKRSQGVLLTLVVLVLVYWAAVYAKWSSAEEVQKLLVRFLCFAFGVGMLLSAFEWRRPNAAVFFFSASIPLLATLLAMAVSFTVSEAHAGAFPDLKYSDALPFALLLVAAVICILHGLVALAGFHVAMWAKRSLAEIASDRSRMPSEAQLKAASAALGVITSLLGLFAGK